MYLNKWNVPPLAHQRFDYGLRAEVVASSLVLRDQASPSANLNSFASMEDSAVMSADSKIGYTVQELVAKYSSTIPQQE